MTVVIWVESDGLARTEVQLARTEVQPTRSGQAGGPAFTQVCGDSFWAGLVGYLSGMAGRQAWWRYKRMVRARLCPLSEPPLKDVGKR